MVNKTTITIEKACGTILQLKFTVNQITMKEYCFRYPLTLKRRISTFFEQYFNFAFLSQLLLFLEATTKLIHF